MSSSFYVNLILIFIVNSLPVISSGNAEHSFLRGVPPKLQSKYVVSKPFACLDGSANIPFEFVNDDYCDCRDGSDEPGTSACPNGRFYCENKGYIGSTIPSHFVGDGVCDCCDGSDEYETRVVCNNTCFELAQKTQAEREAKRALHEAGVNKKKEIMAKSVVLKAERQTKLDELNNELVQAESLLKEKEELKQKAEAPETEAKDKQQKLWDEQRAVREALENERKMKEMFDDLDTNHDSSISIEELQKHTELDTDLQNEFTVEEVRSILGADSVNFDEFNQTVFDQISNSYRKLSDVQFTTVAPPSTETTEAVERPETEGDYEEEEEFDHPDSPPSPPVATSLEHEKHIHDDTPPEYDDETKNLIQIADQARNEFYDAERKVQDIKRQQEDLKRQADVDIGVHGEYAAFIDQCYDYEEREYTYRLCMFKDAKQIPKGGGSEVTIGYWDSWAGPTENKYLKMRYGNGATCWNGPSRSLTVTFQCGIEHRPVDVREPTRCEYTMIFETPSACDEKVATSEFHSAHDEF